MWATAWGVGDCTNFCPHATSQDGQRASIGKNGTVRTVPVESRVGPLLSFCRQAVCWLVESLRRHRYPTGTAHFCPGGGLSKLSAERGAKIGTVPCAARGLYQFLTTANFRAFATASLVKNGTVPVGFVLTVDCGGFTQCHGRHRYPTGTVPFLPWGAGSQSCQRSVGQKLGQSPSRYGLLLPIAPARAPRRRCRLLLPPA